MSVRLNRFDDAAPGQFVHLCPEENVHGLQFADQREQRGDGSNGNQFQPAAFESNSSATTDYRTPFLRRAYSVAGLRRTGESVELDVIYRVVGAATRWMQSLRPGDSLSVLGPQGNCFPIETVKPNAWLVSGGVGLPPMLWLAESLASAGKRVVAFCGAQSDDLLPLTVAGDSPPAADASRATLSAAEFAACGVPVIVSTDDGTVGFRGHIGNAMRDFHRVQAPASSSLVVYTCGPERMMHFVADFCAANGIECFVCMERNMACGTGLCQSCVVPVHDATDDEGWRYRLCCTDGTIFRARDVRW